MGYLKDLETAATYDHKGNGGYNILLEWQEEYKRWDMEFGDYSMATVRDEKDDKYQSGSKLKNLKIITVKGDKQADIDRAVADYNKQFPNGPVK